jgi:hypothetical protein
VVVIDEAYHHYVHDSTHHSAIDLVQQGKNVVLIGTFSKAYGLAGARIGYAIGKSGLISSMFTWHLFGTVSRMSQAAARAALTDIHHISETVALNDQAKQYCFDNFSSMGLDFIPSETNFFMVDVGQPASWVSSQLAQRDILVRTGWGMPNHLRVSTGTMEEMVSFITALQEILGDWGKDQYDFPATHALYGNYPNPTNDITRILYALAETGHVRLEIFNIRGQPVKTLVDEIVSPGYYESCWDGKDERNNDAGSGSFFYRLSIGKYAQTRRMIRLR